MALKAGDHVVVVPDELPGTWWHKPGELLRVEAVRAGAVVLRLSPSHHLAIPVEQAERALIPVSCRVLERLIEVMCLTDVPLRNVDDEVLHRAAALIAAGADAEDVTEALRALAEAQ